LKNYFKTWTEYCNENNSVELYRAAYNKICSLLNPQSNNIPKIPVQPQFTLDQEVDTSSQVPVATPELLPWHVDILLTRQSAQQSAVQFYYGE
jgi:hypothetical protein